MKKPEDALNMDKMNVRDGGKQPFTRDAVWRVYLQKMTVGWSAKGNENSSGGERSGHKWNNAEILREELKRFEVTTLNLSLSHPHTHIITKTAYLAFTSTYCDFNDRTTFGTRGYKTRTPVLILTKVPLCYRTVL